MKNSRILAAGAALLIAGAGVLAGGAAAQADDFYLTAAQLTVEHTDGTAYPAGWFQGDVGGTRGTISSGVAGLTATGNQFQLLNGTPAATDLTEVSPWITMSSGDASFQIPIFTIPGTDYTTLYADAASIAIDAWYTTNAVGTFTAGSAHTLEEYQTEFPDLEILAFGFNKIAASTATVASLDWNGDTYWFLPTPTSSITPSPVTPAALASTGVVFTASGYIPGETVEFGIGYGNSGDSLGVTAVADANGTVTNTFIAAAGDPALTPGTYSLNGFGNTSGANIGASFVVAAALPLMGTDPTLPIAAAGTLLLAGAVFLLLAARRRRVAAI